MNIPFCSHGPAKLFERPTAKGIKRFYACSANRDRKNCPLYVLEEDVSRWLKRHPQKEATLTHIELDAKSNQEKDSDNVTEHIQARTDNKSQAQYFFSALTLDYLCKIVSSLDLEQVVCIGCPRLFEQLRRNFGKQSAFLLDIDARFQETYSRDSFALFNMFNGTFFQNDGEDYFRKFIANSSCLGIFIDPPFGGLVSPIFKSLQRLFAADLPSHKLFLFYPYFMERKISVCDPYMQMSDYQVTYDNHRAYGVISSRSKYGSPIRFFTNAKLGELPAPQPDKLYRFCSDCNAYRRVNNLHCTICATCPSKDGRPYKHCTKCSRCVKETYSHCKKCTICHLPNRCRPKTEHCEAKKRKKD